MDPRVRCFLALVVGTVICYGFGTMVGLSGHMTLRRHLAIGVIPFIIGDLIKIVLAVVIDRRYASVWQRQACTRRSRRKIFDKKDFEFSDRDI